MVPSVTVLVALADFLNVSLDYLVGRSDDPTIH
nr:MAG TPA: CI repressor [Caudoviricetes sp.]